MSVCGVFSAEGGLSEANMARLISGSSTVVLNVASGSSEEVGTTTSIELAEARQMSNSCLGQRGINLSSTESGLYYKTTYGKAL